jgi:hypothetical protein
MRPAWCAIRGGFAAEGLHLMRARLFLGLTLIQAVTFLLLVSLFGLTGSRAPVAVVSQDAGAPAEAFIRIVADIHHSYSVRRMSQAAATAALRRGDLVAVLTIPSNFSYAVTRRRQATVELVVDNIDTDMTEDVQRALPSAIVAFGNAMRFPGIHVRVAETDRCARDTGFIPYLVVSALVLDAFLIGGILCAMTVTREFEARTARVLGIAAVHPFYPVFGRLLAAGALSAVALALPFAVVVFGFHVSPRAPASAISELVVCTAIFGSVGAALGSLLRRTLAVVSLILGLALPLYVCSGSLEPARFDGEKIWTIARCTPVYYGVGLLENAFHGFQVTTESVATDATILCGWAIGSALVAAALLRRRLT